MGGCSFLLFPGLSQTGSTICKPREIQCLPYAGYFCLFKTLNYNISLFPLHAILICLKRRKKYGFHIFFWLCYSFLRITCVSFSATIRISFTLSNSNLINTLHRLPSYNERANKKTDHLIKQYNIMPLYWECIQVIMINATYGFSLILCPKHYYSLFCNNLPKLGGQLVWNGSEC